MRTKVLITGATSGLGLNLCLSLLNQGQEVVASGRNLKVGFFLKGKGARFVAADLENPEDVHHLCDGVATVFHCGAKSSAWGYFDDFYKANVKGTQHVIEGCLKHNVDRLVYVSTPSLYFDYMHKTNISETDPLPSRFVNNYATTKWIAEQAVLKAHEERQLPAIIIRPRAIFGPHDHNIIPRLLKAAPNGRVPIIGNGSQLTDVTYVDNVVHSLLLCANAADTYLGRIYNVTNGTPLPLISLLEKVWDALSLPFQPRFIPYPVAYSMAWLLEKKAALYPEIQEPRLTCYGIGAMRYTQTLDITAIQEDLGYKPLVSIDDGLERYAAWRCLAHQERPD